MKEIKLTQGKVAQVDDEDFEYLNQFKWFALKGHKTFYAIRNESKTDGIRGQKYLHRTIMNTPNNMQVDHIDHNGLNCQKSNMRNCSIMQNSKNKQPRGKSKYLGVTFTKKEYKRGKREYIVASIVVNHKRIHLGHYKTEELAAQAYDNAAQIYHGEFANLNFKTDKI